MAILKLFKLSDDIWVFHVVYIIQPQGRYITKQKRAPPTAVPILPLGGVTKANSRLFQ